MPPGLSVLIFKKVGIFSAGNKKLYNIFSKELFRMQISVPLVFESSTVCFVGCAPLCLFTFSFFYWQTGNAAFASAFNWKFRPLLLDLFGRKMWSCKFPLVVKLSQFFSAQKKVFFSGPKFFTRKFLIHLNLSFLLPKISLLFSPEISDILLRFWGVINYCSCFPL